MQVWNGPGAGGFNPNDAAWASSIRAPDGSATFGCNAPDLNNDWGAAAGLGSGPPANPAASTSTTVPSVPQPPVPEPPVPAPPVTEPPTVESVPEPVPQTSAPQPPVPETVPETMPEQPEMEEPEVAPVDDRRDEGVEVWRQCGGKDYAGPTRCAAGSMCFEYNEWYSQCLPTQ